MTPELSFARSYSLLKSWYYVQLSLDLLAGFFLLNTHRESGFPPKSQTHAEV